MTCSRFRPHSCLTRSGTKRFDSSSTDHTGVHAGRITRTFPFRRETFDALVRAVRDRLADTSLKPDAIIVHGQSGVGKSIALADLALKMKQEAWPVIYFGKAHTRIDRQRIDAACQGLERLQNVSALIIVDGLLDPLDYGTIADYLAARGRKAVVLGSSYKAGSQAINVEFPATMSEHDQRLFVSHLATIERRLVDRIGPKMLSDRHFLASLYRTLQRREPISAPAHPRVRNR